MDLIYVVQKQLRLVRVTVGIQPQQHHVVLVITWYNKILLMLIVQLAE